MTTANSNGEAPQTETAQWPDLIRARSVATLPEAVQQGIELTRQHTIVAGEIAAMQWGAQMTPMMRRAVSAYCERWGVDPLTELDVLGGSFYINSEFYLRKLGELRRAGVIADFWFEHIHNDPRLKAMMDDQRLPQTIRDEAMRRWSDALFKRAEQNAPEDAKAICICYITLPGGGHPIKGCKWAGNSTSVKQPRSGGPAQPNPIAESNAELSVESMAARRAARQIISHVGDGSVPNFDKMAAELEELSVSHSASLDVVERAREASLVDAGPPRALASPTMDAYTAPVKEEPAAVYRRDSETLLTREQVHNLAQMPSPYEDDPAPTPAPAPVAAAPVRGVCHECGSDVVVGDPTTHKADCSKFAD